MSTRKNAILLFSKVPQEGKVKTRLTTLKDGYLDAEYASRLYAAMLFDVAECCMDFIARMEARAAEGRIASGAVASAAVGASVEDSYDIVISSPGIEQMTQMRELFAQSGTWSREIRFISDTGANFDEHYNDAFAQVWDMGYETILSMGCDMPALTQDVLVLGFSHLHELCDTPGGGVVLSPDQEMGVSIVGWTRDTSFDHAGVFYCQSGLTVLPAYIEKCRAQGLPARYIPAVPDVDTWADLRHNITLVQAIEYAAQFQDDLSVPHRTLEVLAEYGLVDVRVAPNDLMDPRDEIDL